MGFLNKDLIILNEDVSIEKLSIDSKIEELSDYDLETRIPTKSVMEYLGDSIYYTIPVNNCWIINDNKLESFIQFPNCYEYNYFGEVINHLSNRSKSYYLVKLTKYTSCFKLYVFEKSNISVLREEKINKILDNE